MQNHCDASLPPVALLLNTMHAYSISSPSCRLTRAAINPTESQQPSRTVTVDGCLCWSTCKYWHVEGFHILVKSVGVANAHNHDRKAPVENWLTGCQIAFRSQKIANLNLDTIEGYWITWTAPSSRIVGVLENQLDPEYFLAASVRFQFRDRVVWDLYFFESLFVLAVQNHWKSRDIQVFMCSTSNRTKTLYQLTTSY